MSCDYLGNEQPRISSKRIGNSEQSCPLISVVSQFQSTSTVPAGIKKNKQSTATECYFENGTNSRFQYRLTKRQHYSLIWKKEIIQAKRAKYRKRSFSHTHQKEKKIVISVGKPPSPSRTKSGKALHGKLWKGRPSPILLEEVKPSIPNRTPDASENFLSRNQTVYLGITGNGSFFENKERSRNRASGRCRSFCIQEQSTQCRSQAGWRPHASKNNLSSSLQRQKKWEINIKKEHRVEIPRTRPSIPSVSFTDKIKDSFGNSKEHIHNHLILQKLKFALNQHPKQTAEIMLNFLEYYLPEVSIECLTQANISAFIHYIRDLYTYESVSSMGLFVREKLQLFPRASMKKEKSKEVRSIAPQGVTKGINHRSFLKEKFDTILKNIYDGNYVKAEENLEDVEHRGYRTDTLEKVMLQRARHTGIHIPDVDLV